MADARPCKHDWKFDPSALHSVMGMVKGAKLTGRGYRCAKCSAVQIRPDAQKAA